jgi:hypothetical protein
MKKQNRKYKFPYYTINGKEVVLTSAGLNEIGSSMGYVCKYHTDAVCAIVLEEFSDIKKLEDAYNKENKAFVVYSTPFENEMGDLPLFSINSGMKHGCGQEICVVDGDDGYNNFIRFELLSHAKEFKLKTIIPGEIEKV